MAKKTISFRIEEELLQKLRTIAEYENRTMGGQITVLVRKCVEQYENRQTAAVRRAQKIETADRTGAETI